LAAATLLVAPSAHAAWSMHGGNPQHTAVSAVPAQPLQSIHWQMPVDLNPQYSGTVLFIHYGSPLVTEGNTVIVPVKVGVQDTFRVEGRRGSDGLPLWQLATDYTLPPHSWVPSVTPTLAHAGRLYVPAAGGTLLWTSALDAAGPHTTTRVAFYGNAAYAANPAAFNASLKINTPLTADAKGTVYFGFVAVVANPLVIQSGIAAVDANGVGRYVSVDAASGHVATQIATNCAPALSRDEQTIYVACRGGNSAPSYLMALATADLSTLHVRPLVDPHSLMAAAASNNGTATPMVAPDDKVYYGVLENPGGTNASRGWMLQFDKDLNPAGPPGAFGWDHTPSLVPALRGGGLRGLGALPHHDQVQLLRRGRRQRREQDRGRGPVRGPGRRLLGHRRDERGEDDPLRHTRSRRRSQLPDRGEGVVHQHRGRGHVHQLGAGGRRGREALPLEPHHEHVQSADRAHAGPGRGVHAHRRRPRRPGLRHQQRHAVRGRSDLGGGAAGAVAAGLSLSLPQPNPLTRLATLRFRLPRAGDVTLEVLDLAGQRVKLLERGVLPAGEHVATWDGTDARGSRRAPGVYFVRLYDGTESVSTRVVVAR
jgi:hypothetical protein